MSETKAHRWTASDGVELTFHELGKGRSVVLLHGLFSDANMNWIRFGHAARIVDKGFRVIMPDLRAHGLSSKPHGVEYYPRGSSLGLIPQYHLSAEASSSPDHCVQ